MSFRNKLFKNLISQELSIHSIASFMFSSSESDVIQNKHIKRVINNYIPPNWNSKGIIIFKKINSFCNLKNNEYFW